MEQTDLAGAAVNARVNINSIEDRHAGAPRTWRAWVSEGGGGAIRWTEKFGRSHVQFLTYNQHIITDFLSQVSQSLGGGTSDWGRALPAPPLPLEQPLTRTTVIFVVVACSIARNKVRWYWLVRQIVRAWTIIAYRAVTECIKHTTRPCNWYDVHRRASLHVISQWQPDDWSRAELAYYTANCLHR